MRNGVVPREPAIIVLAKSPVAGRVIANLIEAELGPLLIGENAIDNERLFAIVQNRFRSTGWWQSSCCHWR